VPVVGVHRRGAEHVELAVALHCVAVVRGIESAKTDSA
jgi:hypothetical protein